MIPLTAGVITDPERLAKLGKDKWFAAALPEIAVAPGNAKEVAAVLGYANKLSIPVTTRGAGYGYVGGCVPVRGGILMSMHRMNRIKEINDADFVAVVEPAVITGVLQEAAQKKGLFYPPDPASLKDCSIGGNIATNAGGPRCLKYGVTRPYILGLQVALADGTLVRVGGRTHKNKTGFDLVGMFVGSEGMLGVITEATLRLLPNPPARATLSAGFASMRDAAAAVQAIFKAGFLPCAMEVADSFTLQSARDAHKEVKGTFIPPGKAHLLIEIDGQKASVLGEGKALKALLARNKALGVEFATSPERCDRMWALRRAFSASLKATGLTKLNEDIAVPRGRLVDLIAFAEKLQKKTGFPIACFGHAGDGNIHVNVMVSKEQQAKRPKEIEGVLDSLFTQVIKWGGAITGEHGIGLAKKRWWNEATSPELRDLHKRIKKAVDPNGILNPGKFV
ncbi:MAG: FAD-binding protein [Verrucomicrobia bacterium]|nr:FAD-binding protein [Verrucomicrobiota bacterium]